MARAVLCVLDSFGIGGAPDAARYGDAGADTFGHIREACLAGRGDAAGLRAGPLRLPNMERLGLLHAAGLEAPGAGSPAGLHGSAVEVSNGKDTPSGHWEIAGCPVRFDWGYFPRTVPALPADLVAAIVAEAGLPGILGDRHASGTQIVDALGAESMATAKPILYTSSDSVLQIAAHEELFGLERLDALCRTARRLTLPLNIGRVISRPFLGTPETGFSRTANRRDYAVSPPAETLLDRLTAAGREVVGIGKIGDIFAGRGVGRSVKGAGNMALFDATLTATEELSDGGLVFANFVDFDQLYGHRRDVPGYAAALEAFDRRLPELASRLRPGDVAILTADHGCDPTHPGTDHTREAVPILGFGPGLPPRDVGRRESFADIAASLGTHLGIGPGPEGRSFL